MTAQEIFALVAEVDPEVWNEKLNVLGLADDEIEKLAMKAGDMFTPLLAGILVGVTLSECSCA